MHCFLSVGRLRCFVTALSFGCVFLWILSGQYLEGEQQRHPSISLDVQSLPERPRRQLSLQKIGGAGFIFRRRLLLLSEAGELRSATALRVSAEPYYNPGTAKCSDVHRLNVNSSKCTYVRTVDSCQNDDGLLVYLDFIYCAIPYRLIPLAMVVLFFWLVFLFIFLGATAEEYFCPALKVMSETLHLSQNVAGVTLLALGNGAPDIFSAFAAITQSDDHKSSLAIGALFGAGIFVTTIVVGGVALLTPFQLTKRPFLRDIIFYTVAVYWTFYLLWINTVNIYMGAGFIALYITYVAVVIFGRIVYQRWKKEAETKRHIKRNLTSSGFGPNSKQQRNGSHRTFLPPSSLVHSINANEDGVMVPTVITKEKEYTSGEEAKESEGEREQEGEAICFTGNANSSSTETESKAREYQGGSLQVTTDDDRSEKTHLNLPPSDKPQRTRRPSDRKTNSKGSSEKVFGDIAPLFPQFGNFLAPHFNKANGGRRTVSPTPNQEWGWRHAQRQQWPVWDDEERPRSASPRKLLRKSLTGALDVSEEVVAAVGLPHVPEIWDEIQRVHHHRNSPLTTSTRSRCNSGVEEDRSRHGSFRDEDTETEENVDENTLLVLQKPAKQPHPFIYLLLAFYPFGEDFRQLGLVGKIYEIVKYPCNVLLTLTVPVIDSDAPLHNWNRWLNILHCVTGPLIITLLTKTGIHLIGGVFPVWTVVLIVGVLVAILVACTSHNDRRPIYHCVFAWLGFAISVVWIYVIANEIVNLLQAFGVVVKLSDGILGITLLAWGNSIGDAVANMTMARQGFPRMAIGACYGGPLLNILIGVGVASLYKSVKTKDHKFTLYFSQVEMFAAVFLMATLALSLVAITLMKFRIFRPFAICLVAFYVVFLIVAILAEIPVFTISIGGVLTHS